MSTADEERARLRRDAETHWRPVDLGSVELYPGAVADHPELIRRWVIQTRKDTHPRGPLWLTREQWRKGKAVEQRVEALLHGPHTETLEAFEDVGEMAVHDPTMRSFIAARVLLYRRRIPGLFPMDEVSG